MRITCSATPRNMSLLTKFWCINIVVLFLVLSSGLISVASALARLSNILLWNDAADPTYNGSVIPVKPPLNSLPFNTSTLDEFFSNKFFLDVGCC